MSGQLYFPFRRWLASSNSPSLLNRYSNAALNNNVKRTVSISIPNHATIGFIGCGNMGANMATNLMAKGHELVLYDPNPDAVKDLVAGGRAKVASNPAEVAGQVERLITMVPTPADSIRTYCGPDGIIAHAKKDTILIDSSTVDPGTSRAIEQEASAQGIRFVDAPVTGAVPAARAGTLTFIVGGPADTVNQIRDLLLCMGKNVIHCGPIGMGSVAKLCNNMMLAISMIGTAETLNMGERLGLDPKLMTQILNISSGRTWVSEGYNPVPGVGAETIPSNNQYRGGFKSALLAKDLNLAQLMSVQATAPTPMGALASQFYRTMVNQPGWAEKDFSSVFQFLKSQEK